MKAFKKKKECSQLDKLNSSQAIGQKKDQSVAYICPMHASVRQEKPGNCPICGMALEADAVSLKEEKNTEYLEMRRRFFWAILLSVPTFILAMGGNFFHFILSKHAAILGQFFLATPVVFWCGWPFFERGWQSLKTRSLNMFTLVAMGIGTAWGYSVAVTFLPYFFSSVFYHQPTNIVVYFEVAAMVTTLILLGQMVDLKARGKTGDAIRALLKLEPDIAHRVQEGGNDQDISLEQVKVGDLLRVRPGERVPVDGLLVEGESYIDESMVTGEAMPVKKRINEKVIGATLNQSGSFVMKAINIGSSTLLSRMIEMVSAAQRSRSSVQLLADKVASWFVPIIIIIAIVTFLTWVMVGHVSIGHALMAAISVLIVACPCALGLATPLSIMVGIGKGAREGILVKNAEALERMEKVTVLVVDKTGTLTEGHPKLTAIITLPGHEESEVLTLAASIENRSEHPQALALMTAAKERSLPLSHVEHFNSLTGKGVTGTINGRAMMIGSKKLMLENHIDVTAVMVKANYLIDEGASIIFMAMDKKLAAVFAVHDPIKPNALDSIQTLERQHIQIMMLTGDNQKTAEAVGKKLGIKQIMSELSPRDKNRIVQELKDKGQIVAMVGDGINDAPALAASDIGIAMGTGSNIAIESAGITLLHGDLSGIVKVRRLSKATMRNIRQNVLFALMYNVLCVPLAAGVLYPLTGLLLNPIFSAIAMSCSSLFVTINALRLRTLK